MKKWIGVLLTTLLLAACSSGGNDLTTDAVIESFKSAGLEAEKPREMTKDDYGIGPMKSKEGQIVKLPSVCDDCNARILSYDNEEDLDQMKAYYDVMGEESAMLFSWTIKHKNILVQLNGDLPEEEFTKYKEAVESL